MPRRDVLAVFPPDDPVALFVVSFCMAGNDVEDALREIASFDREEDLDNDEVFHRNRFSYRVRLLSGHLFEGIVALKAWRQKEQGVQALLASLEGKAKDALALVCSLDQQIGPTALNAIRQNSFHYPHPDRRRTPDSTVELARAIRENPELEAGIDLGDHRRGTFRFADTLALNIAFSGHDPEMPAPQIALTRRGAHAFVRLVADVYLAYIERNDIGFEFVD